MAWAGLWRCGKELELGPPPPNIQLEEVGQWVPWGLELQLAWKAHPCHLCGWSRWRWMAPSRCKKMVPQLENDAAWRSRSILHCPELGAMALAHCCCRGWCPVWWACRGGVDFVLWCKTDSLTIGPCLGLDLSCTQTQRAKWARSCSISPALKAT